MDKKSLIKDGIFIFIIILFSVFTSRLIKNGTDFYFLDYLIKSIIAFEFFIITIFSIYSGYNNENDDNRTQMFKIIGIFYGFLSIILFFKSIVFYTAFGEGNSSVEMLGTYKYLNAMYYIIEILFIIYIIKQYVNKRNMSVNKVLFSFIAITLATLAMTVISPIQNIFYINGVVILRNITIISGYMYVFYVLFKNKKHFNKKEIITISSYISLRLTDILLLIDFKGYFEGVNFYIIEVVFILAHYILIKALFFEIVISPQKRLNNNLKTLLESKEKIFNNIPDAVILRRNDRIVYVNDMFRDIFNIDKHKDIIGMAIDEVLTKEDLEYVKELEKELDENQQILSKPSKYNINGKAIEIEESGVILPDPNGDMYLFVSRDLENRRRYEDAMQILKKKEEEEKVKNEFLSNISHEFKTPVNVIYAAVQMQEANNLNGNYESNTKYTSSIKQNCLRLIRLVNNIIDMAKIEGGYFSIKPKVINIVTQVENITDSIVEYVKSNELELIFDTSEEEIFCICDEDSVERVMLNLISNAIKYNKKNGEIKVWIDKDDEFAYINVEDNGKGISENELNKIFDRFERLDKSLSRHTEGSGIGLNLTKAFVEINNGTINASSALDEGTTITVKLPLAKEKEIDGLIKFKDTEIKNNLTERVEAELSDIYF